MSLYLVCHETKTTVEIGEDAAGMPYVWGDKTPAMNAFLAYNKGKSFVWMWDHEYEALPGPDYTFFTNEDDPNKNKIP